MEERAKKKALARAKAQILAAELDQILSAEKQRKAIEAGGKPVEEKYKLYQTLFPYTSADEDDLAFGANEIIR